MHREQFDFVQSVRQKHPYYFQNKFVLEIGSLNLNGSVRQLFNNCNYIGIDVGPGKDVDIVCMGHEYNAPDNSFDMVLSCETLEHDPHWKLTFKKMIDLCKPGGLVLMTCATTGRQEHGTIFREPQSSPNTVQIGWNHYKNLTEDDIRKICDLDNLFYFYYFLTNTKSCDLYFYGIKC